MDTEQPAPDAPCGICDHPHQGHGTRYTAGRGDHEWTEPQGLPFKSHTELHTATRSHDWLQDRPVQESRIVDHPAGGITQEWVTVPEARENPAPEREPGGVSDQPTASSAFSFTEFGERIDRPGLFRRIRNATRSN